MSLKDKIAAQRKQIADNKAAFLRSYRFKPGKTMIRILPGTTEPDDFTVEYGAHYIKDPRDSSKLLAVVGDAEICYGKPCSVRQAITDYIHAANDRGDETSAKAAKEWLARRSYVMNILIIGGADKENEGKVVPWEATSNQYDSVLSVIETMLEADTDPFDLSGGLVLVVERTGTGVNDTKYNFMPFPNAAKYPANQTHLDQRVDLVAYRDSKFGTSVVKALGVMSQMLGYDVSQTAVGAAIAGNVQQQAAIGAPASNTPAAQAKAAAAATPAEPVSDLDADLAALDGVTDATFEDAPFTPDEPAVAPSVPASAEVDDIMAELDALS
jgi:hypothetical protein